MFKKIKKWLRRPRDPGGNVYYARLRTPEGVLYKLGYTTKSSLTERLAYSGHGDEKLIDKVYLFAFRKDAWDVEQDLLEHFNKQRAFGKYSNDPAMPLSGRGQSELFRKDILGLDDDLYRGSEDLARGVDSAAGGGCLFMLIGLALAPFTLGLSLLFLFGGASEVAEAAPKLAGFVRRPEHPERIRQLIDELVSGSNSRTVS